MLQDVSWKEYLSDDKRYADLINGLGCSGRQVISKNDLYETDTQTGIFAGLRFIKRIPPVKSRRNLKTRDTIRRAAFGMNFAVIGIENQETIDYEIPLRNLSYDIGEYEKQAARIRREIRRNHTGLSPGEYLYGFKRDSRLYPVITFILYTGINDWDGPIHLHDILDFTDIPEELRRKALDFEINLIEIRKMENTSVFQTDLKQVFDFIRYSEDKAALTKLIENDAYYSSMEEDAFQVAAHYTNAADLIKIKDYHRKDGKINMCTAIKELIADGKATGIAEGRTVGIAEGKAAEKAAIIANLIQYGLPDKDIQKLADCDQRTIDAIKKTS